MSREKFKGDNLTWNRDLWTLFGPAVQSREDTWAESVEARLAGCETVSVTDSLRPPDRLAESIVSKWFKYRSHREEKKRWVPERRSLCPFRRGVVYRRLNDVSAWTSKTPSKLVLLLPRRVLSIHPVSFPARYIDCINIGTLCIAFAWTECSFLLSRPEENNLLIRL